MKTPFRIISAAILSITICSPALAQDNATAEITSNNMVYDLRHAVTRALEKNRQLRAFQYRAEGAGASVAVARSLLFPRVQASGGWSKIKNPENTTENDIDYVDQTTKTYSLQAQQNLFDGMIRFSNLAQAKAKRSRAEEELRKSELDTINSVQKEFFKLIQVRADINTYEASVKRLQLQREAAEAFFKLEMAPRLTLLQAETALAQTEQKLSRAKSDADIHTTKLLSLLGYAETGGISFQGNLQEFSYDAQLQLTDCVSKAQEKLPELLVAKKDIEIAKEDLNMTIGKFFPKVDASASYVKQDIAYNRAGVDDRNRKYYTMGLNFSWEVFSSGETVYDTKAKNKILQAAEEEFENTRLNVYAYVQENYRNLMEAKTQIKIALIRTREAQEAYDQASMRFRSGIGTSIDLLDAQEKATTAEAALNQARADYLISLSNLYRAMGEKNERLGHLVASN